jgi:hypothetical protein
MILDPKNMWRVICTRMVLFKLRMANSAYPASHWSKSCTVMARAMQKLKIELLCS